MMAAHKQNPAPPIKRSHGTKVFRAAWYVFAAVSVTIFLLSIPAYFLTPVEFRLGVVSSVEPGWLVNAMSVFGFLGYEAAALISLSLAGVLFVKYRHEGIAFLLSFLLLVYGAVVAGPMASLELFLDGTFTFTFGVIQPILFLPLLIAFLSVFPDGRFVPSKTCWLVVFSMLYAPSILLTQNQNDLNVSTTVYYLRALLWFVFVFAGLYAQIYRYLRVSDHTQRLQTKWVIFGFTVTLLIAFIMSILTLSFRDWPGGAPLPWLAAFGSLGWPFAFTVMPISLTFAIIRYRLYDIDSIFNRTLVYGALTATIVALYALSVGVLSVLFQVQGNPIIALLATGFVAVLFQPLRERLQGAINRLFYGQRDDPLIVLSQLGKRLEATIAPEVVLPNLIETIAQSLTLPYVAISLRSGEEFIIAAKIGDEIEDALRIPLIYQGEILGQLIVSHRGPGDTFNQTDRELLGNIAHQAGPAVYAVQLTRDLRRSRVRLVSAREEERRRIRRDLHDGLGPMLASFRLKIGSAVQLLDQRPDKARAIFKEIEAGMTAAIGEIRRLVYDLRPPALDELGLVRAIKQDAPQVLNLEIRFDTPEEVPELPAAVDVAAYRIIQEALNNCVNHAQASRVKVGIHAREYLDISIEDNGIGIAESYRPGVGLRSMRERAEELGGSFEMSWSTGEGTNIHVRLPLEESGL